MLKVAFIYLSNYDDWPMGGMLNYAKNLIPHLRNYHNWNMDIWGGQIKNQNNKNTSVNVYTTIRVGKKIVPNFISSFWGIIKNKKKFADYDVIYSHTSATTIAMKICYPHKFVVHHQHGLSYKDNKGVIRILNIGYTLAQLMSDLTFFVASEDEVADHSKKFFGKKRFFSIGSPIDFEYIKNIVENRISNRFIYTGRIDSWKNIGLLINSFVLFHKSHHNAELHIIGDGLDFEAMKQLIVSTKSGDYIHMKGRLEKEEIAHELKKSDVFLFPSKGEGVSLSILEALAAGLPIVGFNVTGVKSLIKNGTTGILVNHMNQEDFSLGIERVLICKESMREPSIKFAEQFDAKVVAEEIIDKIEKVYGEINDTSKNYN